MIRQIANENEKRAISRKILEALPDWFGLADAREQYIADSARQPFFAAEKNGEDIGFLCLKETGKSTVELAVMGVLREFHRQGVGRALFNAALDFAKGQGYEFIQVKTVAMGHYEDYDDTNRFYQSLGFKEFEIFPTLWGEANPCQVYVRAIG